MAADDPSAHVNAAPDVRVVVSVNGRPLGGTGVAQDTLAPSWVSSPVDVGVIPEGAFLKSRATEADLMFDDDIGANHRLSLA